MLRPQQEICCSEATPWPKLFKYIILLKRRKKKKLHCNAVIYTQTLCRDSEAFGKSWEIIKSWFNHFASGPVLMFVKFGNWESCHIYDTNSVNLYITAL